MNTMRNYFLFILIIMAIFQLKVASADNSLIMRADEFISLLKNHNYKEGAQFFHYPENYNATKLVADQTAISTKLGLLFEKIGEIETINQSPFPAENYIAIGLGGGDVPYWSSHPELNQNIQAVYRVKTKHISDALIVIYFVQIKDNWEIRSFHFEIPTLRPDAMKLAEELTKLLYTNYPK
ncbi:hypothetical protein [Methylomonas sp. AM2-LC]|uniref:hypothetical protein n=1 Tax=Methylomonas sp. AM2-LC TaxID=3153301 RepID=UPI003267719B